MSLLGEVEWTDPVVGDAAVASAACTGFVAGCFWFETAAWEGFVTVCERFCTCDEMFRGWDMLRVDFADLVSDVLFLTRKKSHMSFLIIKYNCFRIFILT